MGIFDILTSGVESVVSAVGETAEITRFLTEANQRTASLTQSGQRGRVLQVYEELLLKYGADKKPETKLGRLYQRVRPQAEESRKPTADPSCSECCSEKRSLCGQCLPLRKKALYAISLIGNEGAFQSAVSQSQASIHACAFCSAPLNGGEKFCPYCGTSARTDEPKDFNAEKAVSSGSIGYAVDSVYEYTEFAAKSFDAKEAGKMISELIPFASAAMKLGEAQMSQIEKLSHEKMNAQTAQLAAEKSGLTPESYLRAVMEGAEKNYALIVYEENLKKAREAEAERRRQQTEANQRIYEAQRRNNENSWAIRQNSYRAPQYSGGSGINASDRKCCGNCSKYMAASGECALNHIRRNATEFCGSFSMR